MSVVIPAVVIMLLYRMYSGGAPGSKQRDARPDALPARARPAEPIPQPARVAAAVPQCTDALELSGRWLATTTVVGAIRRVQSVNGWYAFEFDRDPCKKGVTIEKTGYEDTVFEPEKVQRGHASVERVGQWGAHEVLKARVSLAREGGQQVIHRMFHFIRVDEDTLAGEWRQVDEAWDEHGMWGYFVAQRGASTSPRGDDREALPCVLKCRLGCDALRREADDLPPHEQLDPCAHACAEGHERARLCSAPKGFSMSTETIGELRLGMTTAEVHAALGVPTYASRPFFEAATGETVTTWQYPREGMTLEMTVSRFLGRAPGSSTLRSISVTSPSRRVTSKGIGIGTEVAAIMHAYGRALDGEMTSPERVVVGSIFGGLILDVADGRVRRMFLGAAAE